MIDIYLITNKVNGKRYVGKTQRGYLKRFESHCLAYGHGVRTHIACAIHQFGRENFEVELIRQVSDDSWEYWENYYIKEYHTHYTEGGYNSTWGGDANPMDDPRVREKHMKACMTDEFREKQRKISTGKKHTEKTRMLCRKRTLDNLDICIRGFRKYNESKKVRIGIVENDVVVMEFDCLSDACEYCGRPRSEAGQLYRVADKFNKNGTRMRMYGHHWTLL